MKAANWRVAWQELWTKVPMTEAIWVCSRISLALGGAPRVSGMGQAQSWEGAGTARKPLHGVLGGKDLARFMSLNVFSKPPFSFRCRLEEGSE